MTTQPEALRLADQLETIGLTGPVSAELRRLHAELERCKQVCAATSEGWRADAETRDDIIRMALEAMTSFESGTNGLYKGEFAEEIAALKAALVEDAMQKFTDVSQEIEAALADGDKLSPGEPVAMDWLHKWANQDDGEPETQWHEGYEAARRVVQIHLTAPPQRPAEPVQEPVAWMVYTEGGTSAYVTDNPNDLVGAYRALPLYTTPPQRKPLDDLAVADIYAEWDATPGVSMADFARAVEAAHGIKE